MVDACDYVRREAFWALRRHLPGGFLICQKIIILEEVNENHRIWASCQLAAAVKTVLIWMFVSCLTTAFDIANVGTNMTAAVKTVLMWMLTGRSGQNSCDLDVCWLSHDCI